MADSGGHSHAKESTSGAPQGEGARQNAMQGDGVSRLSEQAIAAKRAQVDPSRFSPKDISVLQRTVGNRTVVELLGREAPSAASETVVQAKLTVGPANDAYEQEADDIAAQVMRMSNTPPVKDPSAEKSELEQLQRTPVINRIQRRAPVGLAGGSVDRDLERSIHGAKTGGSSLSSGIRRRLEPKLNADLSRVKVHTGSKSAQLNRDLGAKAFTHKEHIFFGAGQSPSNLKLTTHEAVHTIQQGAVRQRRVQRKPEEEQPTAPEPSLDVGQHVRRMTADNTIQRAVGFEFEDPTWTVFKVQPGRTFRDPESAHWYNPGSWSLGKIAEPGSEKTDEDRSEEKYTGKNIWAGDGSGDAHINTKVGKFNLQTGPKKGTLHQGTDYKIEPDGPYSDLGDVTNRMDLEIVTEPFPETAPGRERLVAALDDLDTVFERLNPKATGEWNGGDFVYGNFVTPTDHGFTDQGVYLYGGQPGGSFKPQVTSGTNLGDLSKVMETLGVGVGETEKESQERALIRQTVYGTSDATSLGKDASISAVGNAPLYAQTVINNMDADGVIAKGAAGVEQLKGFLAQAILNITVLSPTGQEGIKTSMPLLSRYSLATLFEQVPEDVRNKVKAPGGRISLVARMDEVIKLSIRNFLSLKYPSPGYAGMVSSRSAQGINGPMLTTHLKETVDGVESTAASLVSSLKSFSRREWLLRLLDGEDLLTPDDLIAFLGRDESSETDKEVAGDYDKSIAIYLRGYGNTKNVKDVEGEERGGMALFENRNVNPWKGARTAPGISLAGARAFALNYFDWLMSIKQARDEKTERAKVQEQRLKDDSHKRRTMFYP